MLILTYITSGYIHWFKHLYINLQLLNLHDRLHVCTSHQMKLPINNVTILSSNIRNGPAQTFGSKEYGKIVNRKHDCILKFYKVTDVLFLDTDVTLFHSPIPFLKNSKVPLFLEDSGPFRRKGTLNSGCMYLPRTKYSIKFMSSFVKHLKRENSLYDQDVLNKYKNFKYSLLDPDLFINGFRFYENRHKHALSNNIVLVHHNWISGDKNKWNRAKSFNCILNESSRWWFSDMLNLSLLKQRWIYKK